MLTLIPFTGFYESIHSEAIDQMVEQIADHHYEFADTDGLDPRQVFELFNDCTNYRQAYEDYAKAYTERFSTFFEDETGLKLDLTFVHLDSPREYNFSTDVIQAKVDYKQVHDLLLHSAAENHRNLKEVMTERFTSHSGFISFYSPDLADHLEAGMSHWDENQVQCLIDAALRQAGVEEYEVDLNISEQIDVFRVVEAAVDWERVEDGLNAMKAQTTK